MSRPDTTPTAQPTTTPDAVATPAGVRRLRLARSTTDRVVAGVAGGIAERFGIDPVVVRLAFVVLAFAGGFGALLYLGAWLVSSEDGPETKNGQRAEAAFGPGVAARRAVAVALMVVGALLVLRTIGLWFGDGLVASVALAAIGSAVIWFRDDGAGRARLERVAARISRRPFPPAIAGTTPRLRIAAGALLILAGMTTFLAANDALAAARNVVFAVAVTASGLALILGPWVWRMGRQLQQERRERIRSEERADLAAHLHDSVLQTLALIQRTNDPQRMATLARGQERELRAWLYGGRARDRGTEGPSLDAAGAELLSVALDRMAGRVERLHQVRVEVVTVGDCPLNDRLRALVEAAGQAISNAAAHSGAPTVSVYAEVEPDAVRLYVRDQGRGFDPSAVPADRRGIADSIRGRVERHGGVATIESEPGQGTDVQLRMPRSAA